jgi:glutamine amidotransferase
MTVLVIDYGMGNLGSVCRAIEECGGDPMLSDDPKDIKHASWMILPGVGAFPDGMKNLHERGWVEPLAHAVREESIPLLGICLGMQLLADRGFEGTETLGLGFIAGDVRLLKPANDLRVPHVGWNDVHTKGNARLFDGIPDGSDFYFVHSYHFVPTMREHIAAVVEYGGEVVAAVADGNVWGAQFHPEKSSRAGFHLLKNFLSS